MRASVIVPTWRGGDRIGPLLDALARQSVEHEVIVVDNGSVDATAEVLKRYPAVKVIRRERNVGFGPAVNLGAAQAEGEAIVLVNDDSVCDPGFVEAIVTPLGGDVAMSAGVMRDHDDPGLIDTAGMELDPTLLVFDYLHGEPLDSVETAPAPIGPSGAAAAFDRTAFLDSGGFDEALFAYWEDVDLVLRLRLAGAECALAPGARGTHKHSATLGPGSAEKNRLMGYGRGYLLRKWSVLRGPRVLTVLAKDGAICLGQALMDRNLSSLSGRVDGLKAGRPRFEYPAEILRGRRRIGVADDLRRRLRRRRRLSRRRAESQSARVSLEQELEAIRLPPRLPVGRGNALFLAGRLNGEGPSGRDVELLVDGSASEATVTVVRPEGERRAYWWATQQFGPVAERQTRTLSLSLGDGRALSIGEIELEPGLGPLGDRRSWQGQLAAAVEAAGAGELVAICMATYRPPIELFAKQIESIKRQTHPGWICLLSDDGSDEASLEAMRGVVGEDPRFVWLEHSQRLGFYGNYERVLAAVPAKAPFVALADQDDRWYPDKLESLLQGIGDRDLVYSDMRIVTEEERVLSDTYWDRRRNNYTDLVSLLVGNTVTGAASLFRRDLLERALPFPPRLNDGYHDHWIALIAMTGRGLAYVDRPLQDYVQHGAAAQGHAEANAGARYLQPRLFAVLGWQAARALLGGRAGEGWAKRYFGMYTRTVMWARLLLARSADTLATDQRRLLERVAEADDSALALTWLAGRSLRPLWGANEAFGREVILVSSVLWQRALQARSRVRRPVQARLRRGAP